MTPELLDELCLLRHLARALQAERGAIIEALGLGPDMDGHAETLVPAVQKLRAENEALKAELARLVLTTGGANG